ncbi:hypothetical protein SDRG_13738 [Saprolegnia diclina VS20]|uniref:N-acetylglucosaminylphosphatidylinositol deacetylase n=1 Tax=Saprolegnia diclina (strain VS20) TaxID=1156394 RepID=T0PSE7_SAPDV|nr:hypothetical protein SDRG_13738 [Saprolegnia diclina VS20]EQC28409.1 hypothetical protein SDRG_13738 [Saprolegnia diclina VS20]|eukprot:XP_008618057.1 hypothetical protein SDRG_13738 [Saprolegnia diclina VS20]
MDWAAAVLAALVSAAVALRYLSWKSHSFVETILAHRAHSDKAAASRPDVLLVIAHPDDESMFFVPILLRLRPHVHWHLLCLSSGNYDGLGAIRTKELAACWHELGMDAATLTVLEDARFQDGMKSIWTPADVATATLAFVAKHKIDTMVTFDDYGVSGHPNHISVHNGVKHALATSPLPLHAYALDSVRLWHKYLGPLDAIWTSPSRTAVVAVAPWVNYAAMAKHTSQFVWFRRLFVVFSRYTFLNTFTPLHAPTKKTL